MEYDVIAYVDGSYNKYTKDFSYGVVIFHNGEEKHFSEKISDPRLAKMHNVAGEIRGSEVAMQYCLNHNAKSLLIYYDYAGIENWCTGSWQAKKPETIAYKNFYNKALSKIKIDFAKVKAHSGVEYNEVADMLAKQAIGIPISKNILVKKEKPKMNTQKIGACFASMRIKYDLLNNSIVKLNLGSTRSVNVFVNMESVFYMLGYMYPKEILDITDDVISEMESMFIDVAAHYKYFFRQLVPDVRVFLYYTDPESSNFSERGIDERFRERYQDMFYDGGPAITVALKDYIFNDVVSICNFIPDVYCIRGKNIDSGQIPLILQNDKKRNIVISSDVYDLQYAMIDNFSVIYKTKLDNKPFLVTTAEDISFYLTKETSYASLLTNQSFLRLALCGKGNTIRSISHIRNKSPKSLLNDIKNGIESHVITEDTKNIELLLNLFPIELRNEVLTRFALFDLCTIERKLGNGMKDAIRSQLIDRSDINALQNLNQTRFVNRPIWLHGLL